MAAAYKKRGSLHSAMGRPKTGAMSSFPAFLQNRVKAMRTQHEGWGPTTLLAELKADEQLCAGRLPSRSTIGQFLQQEKLSRNYEPHSPLPVEPCKKAKRCHSLWQIDGQGNSQVPEVGPIAMLNIKDVHSSVYVSSFPAKMKSMTGHPNTSDYQTAMRLGFIEHGLPRRLQSGHASVFYENKSKSPFPTVFCLWLVGLGVEPCYSRVHQPTDQAQVEKAHQTVFDQVLRGRNDYKSWEHLFEWCKKRRIRLNESIPSRATDKLPPLKKYPKAKHSGRFYQPQMEAGLIDMKAVFAFLAKGKWFRTVAGNKTVSLGGQAYYISGAKHGEQLKITFCKQKQNLVFQNDKELEIAQMPIKGITPERLMGNMERFVRLPASQFEFPFNWEAQKVSTTFSDSA